MGVEVVRPAHGFARGPRVPGHHSPDRRGMGNNPAHGRPAAIKSARPRGARRHRRAGDLPQCRDRLLRAACQGARAPRPRHRRRPCGDDLGGRVDHGVWRLGQRPHPWSAVQGAVHAHLGTQFRRGHREVSRLGHDPRDRPGLCQEDGQGLRREGVRHHRGRAGSAARGRRHRAGTRPAHHRSLGRAEDRARDHGLSAQPRRRHGARGSDLSRPMAPMPSRS